MRNKLKKIKFINYSRRIDLADATVAFYTTIIIIIMIYVIVG